MATILPSSEEVPALAVVHYASEHAWADAGEEVAKAEVNRLCDEALQLMETARWLDLVSLMLTSADVILPKVSEKDLECIFTVIANFVTKSEGPEEERQMAKLISGKIAQQPSDKPASRLKCLFNLYNLLSDPYSRFSVYLSALTFAINGKVTETVLPSFKQMDSFLKEWNIGVSEQRQLFLTISDVLKEHKSLAKESFKFLTKYLATFFSEEDASVLDQAKEEAVRTIVEFVKMPDMFQCDLLDMPAVAQLEKDVKHALAHQLLKIFLTQRLDAYLEFQAANSTLLTSYGLIHEECITKMRLISVVDLASHESGRIPYSLIRDTLQINDDEVEPWVVKAITAKLLDCKMDQMNEVVIVSRSTQRVFGKEQWHTLKTKLASWRGNIANVISTVQATRAAADGVQAAEGVVR